MLLPATLLVEEDTWAPGETPEDDVRPRGGLPASLPAAAGPSEEELDIRWSLGGATMGVFSWSCPLDARMNAKKGGEGLWGWLWNSGWYWLAKKNGCTEPAYAKEGEVGKSKKRRMKNKKTKTT